MKTIKLAATAALAIGLSGTAAGPAHAQDTKQIVTDALTSLMIEKDVGAIDTHFGEPYIQHNQTVPTGLDGLKGLAGAAIAENPAFNYKMVRLMVDGDIGIAHGVYEGFGETPLVGFDIFRVQDGMIVEHWDNLAPVADPNPSGRTQIDGPTEIADLDKTDANKALIADFMQTVLVGGDFEKMGGYFEGDAYIQHNSNIADGVSGLGAGLQALAEAGISMRITQNHMLFGEGNFVLAISEGDISGQPTAFYDLFRVEEGKIAEHWDVISPILPVEQAANENGKF